MDLTVKQLAEEYGVTPEAIRARIYRNGLSRTVLETEQTLRGKIAHMKSMEAIEFLLFVIECLIKAQYELKEPAELTPMQARIWSRLVSSPGAIVTHDALMSAMYYDRAGDWPGSKIVDVQICNMRKKLRAGRIETVWGRGYRYVDVGD